MGRLITFLVVVAALVTAAVWLADRPGAVAVEWLGWRAQTTVPVLVAALVLAGVAVLTALRLLWAVIGLPARIAAARHARRQRHGYAALSDGLAAAAAGDAKRARTLARRAQALLKHVPVTDFLAAQAAQLSGDDTAARTHYKAMLDRPETAFPALKGLMAQALAAGDTHAAGDYARRAQAAKPDAPGLALTLFDLEARAGQWDQALSALSVAVRAGGLTAAQARHPRAVALTEQATRAMVFDRRAALRFARQALDAEPGFVPAAVRLATLWQADGSPRRAARAVIRAWETAPHPDLAAVYLGLDPTEKPLKTVQRVERLVARAPNHPDSHLVVAQAALNARLWGQARAHLREAAALRPTAGVYRLLASLEQLEHADAAAARAWADKAAAAVPDAAWHCTHCAATPPAWSALCPHCGTVDGLAWR